MSSATPSNVLGETPTQPDARARMSVATPTRITFSENPVGTYVQSLYVATHGVQFGPTAFIATDGVPSHVAHPGNALMRSTVSS